MSYIDLTTDFSPGDAAGDGPYQHCMITNVSMDIDKKEIAMTARHGNWSNGWTTGNAAGTVKAVVTVEADWDTIMQAANTDDALHQWLIDNGYAAGTVVNS